MVDYMRAASACKVWLFLRDRLWDIDVFWSFFFIILAQHYIDLGLYCLCELEIGVCVTWNVNGNEVCIAILVTFGDGEMNEIEMWMRREIRTSVNIAVHLRR